MIVVGFDSILEELYPVLGKMALDRGYSVLMYDSESCCIICWQAPSCNADWGQNELPRYCSLDRIRRFVLWLLASAVRDSARFELAATPRLESRIECCALRVRSLSRNPSFRPDDKLRK